MNHRTPELASALPHLAVWLAVPDAALAIQFYAAAFGATERYRLKEHGRITVAQLAIGQADFWVQEHAEGPPIAGGWPARLILTAENPDAVLGQAVAAGATEVTPVSDRYGWHSGSLTDPFGYSWDVGRPIPSSAPPAERNDANT